MNRKLLRLLFLIKQDAGLYLGISLGVFLFILFFQPFPTIDLEFNNWLLLMAGFATIIYLLLILVRIFLKWIIMDEEHIDDERFMHSGAEEFIIWLLCSVATIFYMRFVGTVNITIYIGFKIALICLIPTLVVRLYDRLKLLKQKNETLVREKESLQQTIHDYETESLSKSIEFVSDNINKNLVLQLSDIILVRSADNYIEIIYRQEEETKKSIIRSTLKSVEAQLKSYTSFIRCHRTAIVNRYHIENINKKFGNYSLIMRDYEEDIPVSRQYLYKIKELQ